jgi:preprotein translocase subunit SecG
MGLIASLTWAQWFVVTIIICLCLLLMLIILVQKGRGEGLTGAFGGGGGSSAFGAKTGDVFTWITVVVAAAFLLLNVVANFALDESPKDVPAVTTTTEPITILPESEPGEGSTGVIPVEITDTPPGEGTGAIKIEPVEIEDVEVPTETEDADAGTEAADTDVDETAKPADQPAEDEAVPPDAEAAGGDADAQKKPDAPEDGTEEAPSP